MEEDKVVKEIMEVEVMVMVGEVERVLAKVEV